MAWNSDDGVNRYRTDDGQVFNTEKAAEDHYKKQAEDKAAAEAYAKYLAWVKEVCDQAWGMINNGDNVGAIDFLFKQNKSPWQFAYPIGCAHENLGKNESAVHYYSEYLSLFSARGDIAEGNSYNHVLYSRARVYMNLSEWKAAKLDCNEVMYAEHSFGDKRREILGIVFNWRGKCFQNLGNNKMAIFDYKTSSDFGQQDSLSKLSDLGVNYSPKRPLNTLLGKVFTAFIFGVFALIATLTFFLTLNMNKIELPGAGMTAYLWYFILPAAAFIFGLKFWRNVRYKVYPLKKKIFALVVSVLFLINSITAVGTFISEISYEVGATVVITGEASFYGELNKPDSFIKRIPDGVEVVILELINDEDYGILTYVQIEYEGIKGYTRSRNIRRKK